ncbi:MAG: ABC transporter ATP-binding protein [Bacteroidetes bacterium]|nr:ABC transporter ATP-binding protein [Bacteroidota bacterium]
MEPILRLDNITKVYPGVVANKNISFDLQEGEIHAICGENGAGKTTLMRILFGMERPSGGVIHFRGKPTNITSPQDAINLGIGMVHQHFMLVPSFTVAENLVLGIEPSNYTRINKRKAIKKTREIAERYNLNVTPEAKVEDISVAMMQKLEILKALYRGAKILILDEPTAVLTPQETEELFDELILLKEKGHTIIFISHKLKEVKAISNRTTVIRRGEVVGTYRTEDVTETQISEMMIGKLIMKRSKMEKQPLGRKILQVESLSLTAKSGKKILDSINFTIQEGEILGIAGVEGNGQNQLVSILTGKTPVSEGTISFMGNSIEANGIHHMRSLGMAYIPEDRMKEGCAREAMVWENLITNKIDTKEYAAANILKLRKLKNDADSLIETYDILCSDSSKQVSLLSGGNIQKVVVARECSSDPHLLIADQPTRGVDVGAAARIHQKIRKLSSDNKAVLLISADLTELLEVCTSLVVMFEGQITAWFKDITRMDEKDLGLYMLGIKHQEMDSDE